MTIEETDKVDDTQMSVIDVYQRHGAAWAKLQALRAGAANGFSQAGQQIVERELNIQPTLTIRPGFPVRVIVTRDLVLTPAGGGQ